MKLKEQLVFYVEKIRMILLIVMKKCALDVTSEDIKRINVKKEK
jgi:hypothetical protein